MAIDEAGLGKRVGIDTSVLIAMADETDVHHQVSIDVVNTVLSSARTLVVPAIAYGEFLGGGDKSHGDLGRSSGIDIVAFDDVCGRMMKSVEPEQWKQQPQGRHVAKVDVLIAISAKRHLVTLFVSNDKNQVKLAKEMGLNAKLAADLQSGQGLLFPAETK